MHQYFIKIHPKLEVVSCGKLNFAQKKTKFIYHKKDSKSQYFSSKYALSWLDSQINAIHTNKTKVLFFIHGFWASHTIHLNRTTQVFQQKYFKANNDEIAAIIHIIWNANNLYYKNSILSINDSKQVLNEILNNLNQKITKKISLMCHSMGNRFLYESLNFKKISNHFEELLMVAPDLHSTHFESNFLLFSSITNNVYVLYHTKDKTLHLSKIINSEERLGRINMQIEDNKIQFVDLTHINDISSLSDKLMRHNYFINSENVRMEIEKLLRNK